MSTSLDPKPPRRRSRARRAVALPLLAATVLLAACAAGFTGSTKNVTTVGATLLGDVGSTRSEQGTYWFEYGTGATLDKATPARILHYAANEKLSVSERVEGLTPATTYRYRLCAEDQDPDQPHGCGQVKTFATPAVPDLRLAVDPPTSHLPAGLRFTVTNPGPGTTGPAELQIVVHESYPGSFTEVTLFGHRCELRSPRLAVCQLGSIPPGQREYIFEYSHVFPPGATSEIAAIVLQPHVNAEPDTQNNKAVSRIVPTG